MSAVKIKLSDSKLHIRSLIFCGILFFTALNAYAQSEQSFIIPKPLTEHYQRGTFQLTRDVILNVNREVRKTELVGFQEYLRSLGGFTLKTAGLKNGRQIHLRIDSVKISHPEGYELEIKTDQIVLTGADAAGLFYGLQSLSQLIQKNTSGKLTIRTGTIKDYPRFGYRGMHLDVGRHFFPVERLKKWLDILSFYKINTFHWHLTDDQGWRIEIKKYPELQQISAWRDETLIGHKRAAPHLFDGKRYGGYYRQEEVRELIRYAQNRHITIIPEIEMPGHAQAVLAAYPNLGCTGGPYKTATYWGVFEDVFCAGNEQTFGFLEDVLDEVSTLFPSKYIHIGGDECPKTRWKACPKCQQRMHKEGLKDEHELQSYFMGRIEKYLAGKGKRAIGWDEILEGGLTPDATVMSWRGIEGGIAAAKLKHDVIMTPEKYVYLDYYQSLNEKEQIAAGGYTPLKKLYEYEPVPDELSDEEQKYIKGVQANVWSEYLSNASQAEYVMFPRVIGLAEMGWSTPENRNYTDFLSRLNMHQRFLKKVNAFKGYQELSSDMSSPVPGIILKTDLKNAEIRYSLDGTLPTKNSTLYQKPILPAKSGLVKAKTFVVDKSDDRVYSQYFANSLALGKPLHLKNLPQGNFSPDPQVMVNGSQGTRFYNNGEWLGLSGNDFEAVLDLQTEQEISEIGIGILKYHWQKMWAPKVLAFEVSADGIAYATIYSQKDFPLEGINRISHKFKTIKARYIRIKATNVGLIPDGEYGAGGKAWLLLDEITIN